MAPWNYFKSIIICLFPPFPKLDTGSRILGASQLGRKRTQEGGERGTANASPDFKDTGITKGSCWLLVQRRLLPLLPNQVRLLTTQNSIFERGKLGITESCFQSECQQSVGGGMVDSVSPKNHLPRFCSDMKIFKEKKGSNLNHWDGGVRVIVIPQCVQDGWLFVSLFKCYLVHTLCSQNYWRES